MALIRNHEASRMAEDAVVLDLGDLRRQGERMKQQAKAEAERIVAEARAEAQRLTDGAAEQGRKEGYEAGHAEGVEAGRAEGHAAAMKQAEASLTKLQEAWVNAARQWDGERQQMVREARQSLLELAVRMAEKIVRRVPHVEPSVVGDQVAEAVRHVTGPCDVRITIHPADRPLVEEALPGVVEQLGQVRHVSLVEREDMARGGCIVNHGTGRIDATLETQLERLVTTLLPEAGERFEAADPGDATMASAADGADEAEGAAEAPEVDRRDEADGDEAEEEGGKR